MARTPIHPGEILADELACLEITPTHLARTLDVPPNRITQIIKGQRAITADTALRLGQYFSMSPQFWLNLQNQYDLRITEAQNGKAIRRHIKPLVKPDHIGHPASL